MFDSLYFPWQKLANNSRPVVVVICCFWVDRGLMPISSNWWGTSRRPFNIRRSRRTSEVRTLSVGGWRLRRLVETNRTDIDRQAGSVDGTRPWCGHWLAFRMGVGCCSSTELSELAQAIGHAKSISRRFFLRASRPRVVELDAPNIDSVNRGVVVENNACFSCLLWATRPLINSPFQLCCFVRRRHTPTKAAKTF